MNELEKKVLRKMKIRAFFRGLLFLPLRSSQEILKDFDRLTEQARKETR